MGSDGTAMVELRWVARDNGGVEWRRERDVGGVVVKVDDTMVDGFAVRRSMCFCLQQWGLSAL